MWTCIDTEAVQNQQAFEAPSSLPLSRPATVIPVAARKNGRGGGPKKTGAVTARKNGRGGGPKKRTQWRPEKTDPVAARKNGRGGGPKKRARWRPEKTDPLAARKNGKTARKNAPKTDPKTCPKNGPKTARKNGTLGLFVFFAVFPFFQGARKPPGKTGNPVFPGANCTGFRGAQMVFPGRSERVRERVFPGCV